MLILKNEIKMNKENQSIIVEGFVEIKELEIKYKKETFYYNDINIPIREKNILTEHLIPSKRNYLIEDKRKEDFIDILDSITKLEDILLVGEPGCGKSEFVLWIASELNIPVVQIQSDGEMSVVDLVGGFLYSEERKGTYWEDGIIPKALKEKCWILFDEINMSLPEVLARLHSIMDARHHLDLKEIGEVIKRSKDTIIFGTMNPSDDGRHVGIKPLSPALLSRFDIIVNMDFLEEETEKKLIIDKTGVSIKDAELMIKIVTEARNGYKNNEISEIIDTRMLLAWARKTKIFGIKRGIKNTILSRLDKDSFAVLRGVLISYGIFDAD